MRLARVRSKAGYVALMALLASVAAMAVSVSPAAANEAHQVCWNKTLKPAGYYNQYFCTEEAMYSTKAVAVKAISTNTAICINDDNARLNVCGPAGTWVELTYPEVGLSLPSIVNQSHNQSTVVKGYLITAGFKGGGGGGGGSEPPPPPPPPGPEGRWFERNSNTTGIADAEFLYGGGELLPVVGDWNGDGIDTPGAYKPSTGQWFLHNANGPGGGEINFVYGGGPGMIPVVGDWNGDGIDTPGLYKPATGEWFLRNSNTTGSGEIDFIYGGGATTVPIAGDWNGDGKDTIGIVNVHAASSDEWFLRNSNTAGGGEINFTYGNGTELQPVVGDWNGDGIDTPGLFNPNSGNWYERNTNTGGEGETTFLFGGGYGTGFKVVAGDWNGDGIDSPGFVH
jgi:hypothetical protein